jgi:hypothetical protein
MENLTERVAMEYLSQLRKRTRLLDAPNFHFSAFSRHSNDAFYAF